LPGYRRGRGYWKGHSANRVLRKQQRSLDLIWTSYRSRLGATSLDLMQAVYRDSRQPMQRRLRAAVAALPFEHPKLSVAANFNVGFGRRLEQMAAARGIATVIDARPAKAD
jgi:hypothetical protein